MKEKDRETVSQKENCAGNFANVKQKNASENKKNLNEKMNITVNNITRGINNVTSAPVLPITLPKFVISSSDILLICIYVAMFVVGSIGNSLIIRYFGSYKKHKALFHIYLIHLAVGDLICLIFRCVIIVHGILSGWAWPFGSISCKFAYSIVPITINVSAWIVVSISQERYRGIVTPLKSRLTMNLINLIVVAIWIASSVILIPYMLTIELMDEKYCRSKWKNNYYELGGAIEILILQSIIPAAYLIFSITRILQTLRKRDKEVIFLSHPRLPSAKINTIGNSDKPCEINRNIISSESKRKKSTCFCFCIRSFAFKKTEQISFTPKKQRKFILILAVTSTAFIASILPLNMYVSVLAFVKTPWIWKLYPWLFGLATANSLMNCFIYAGMDTLFRRYCFSFFSLFKRGNSLPRL